MAAGGSEYILTKTEAFITTEDGVRLWTVRADQQMAPRQVRDAQPVSPRCRTTGPYPHPRQGPTVGQQPAMTVRKVWATRRRCGLGCSPVPRPDRPGPRGRSGLAADPPVRLPQHDRAVVSRAVLSAEQALDLGLVNEVVPHAELLGRAGHQCQQAMHRACVSWAWSRPGDSRPPHRLRAVVRGRSGVAADVSDGPPRLRASRLPGLRPLHAPGSSGPVTVTL